MSLDGATIAAEDPRSPDARALMDELSAYLESLTGSTGRASFDVQDVCGPRALFAIARDAEGRAQGCGALRPLDANIGEIKRMYVRTQSSGLGSRLLAFLEAQAAQLGYGEVWLETRRINSGAVAFYRRIGYTEISNYGRYVDHPEAICLSKRLASPDD